MQMNKLLILLNVIAPLVYADVDFSINDAAVFSARKAGTLVYVSCITNIPETFTCETLSSKYKLALTKVAAPGVLSMSTETFHYPSKYDVCKYDASHFVLNDPSSQPYCPVNPF